MKIKKQVPFLFLSSLLIAIILSISVLTLWAKDDGGSDSLTYLPVILNPMATATPTPIIGPEWLEYLNGFRAASGLSSLTEESAWSEGGQLHGRYMVKNDVVTHNEDPANEWYTVEGAEAADHGNIYVSASSSATFEQAMDWWLRAPFHAVPLLDPELQRTGFGIYNETAVSLNGFDWQMGATVDVERGRDGLPAGVTFPIFYPANNGTTSFTQFAGNEYPDPLSGCSGYMEPVGSPLIIQLGNGNSLVNVTGSRLQENGIDVDFCLIDENSYVNSDSFEQSIGRVILDLRDAVVLLPRNPLQDGATYFAEVTNDGTTHSWQFTVLNNQKTGPTGFGGAP
ncbi:MAG: CAP domain-containing protein [Chloroflexota bacterium]